MKATILCTHGIKTTLTERAFFHFQDLGDDGLLLGVLRPRLDVFDDEGDLHDVVNRRDQEVGKLKLLATQITVAPLLNKEGKLCT